MFDGNRGDGGHGNGNGDDEIDGEWQWPKSSIGMKISALELSLRCLICSNYLTNPHSLSCGHSYCSECIRKHLDKSYNPTPTSGYCPTCREAAIPAQLRVSKDLIEIVSLYQDLRAELLQMVRGQQQQSIASIATDFSEEENEEERGDSDRRGSQSNGGVGRRDQRSEIKRLPSKLFHIETKEKVKKALEKLTEHCPVKIRLDGDKEALVKRYTEFVHLNNAQVSAKNPLTLAEIVSELHRREKSLEFHQTMSKRSNHLIEKIKSGQETKEVKAGFSELIKRARESKQKKLTSDGNDPIQAPKPDIEASSNSSQNNHNTYRRNPNPQETLTPDSSEKSDVIECGDWIVIQSNQLGRPFFFHVTNQTGQFRIPDELSNLFTRNTAISISAKSDSEANGQSSDRVVRKGTRRSAPMQLQHVADSGDSSDEEYTPSANSSNSGSKGIKRSRSGKKIQSLPTQERLKQTQHQLTQEVEDGGEECEQLSLGQATQPEKYIEIHEVVDDENEEMEELDHVACQQCTYHNPIGSTCCEICGGKLQNTPTTPHETPRKSHRYQSPSSAGRSSNLQKNSPLPFAKKPSPSNPKSTGIKSVLKKR